MKEIKVLFVCLGNICRSPAAEGILKHLAKKDPHLNVTISSRGLGHWHVGSDADIRIREASAARGYQLTSKAQQFTYADFDQFDYILAADHEILDHLKRNARTDEHKSKIYLMTHFSKHYKGQEVPDPYYGGADGFEHVLDILEGSCDGLLKHIRTLKHK